MRPWPAVGEATTRLNMTDIPLDLAIALQQAGLARFFADCTPAHRQEYLKWIGEAKRPETRTVRIEKALQMISAKRAEEESRAKKRAGSRVRPSSV